MKHRNIVALLFTLVLTTSCNGQNKPAPKHFKLVKTQGTGPYDNVHCGLQDRNGNLWFGTTGEGVYRYNATEGFVNFTQKDGLCNNKVWCILEDKEGIIWMGTDAGICKYNPSAAPGSGSASFTGMSLPANDGSSSYLLNGKTIDNAKTIVRSMMQDRSGKIWLSTDNDVYCYTASAGFIHFLHNDGVINKNNLQLRAVGAMIEDRKGNIWFSTWFEGVCRYDGKAITNFKPNGEVWYSGLLEDKTGNIWIGRRDKGVCRYDPTTGTFTNIQQHGILDSCAVSGIAEDKDGNIWFCTEYGEMTGRETMGGVWRYNPSVEGTVGVNPFTNFTTKDGLSNNAVFNVVVEKSGRLWFGTRGMGLSSYDPSAILSVGAKKIIDYK